MQLYRIDEEHQLYYIKEGEGVTGYGFDNLDRTARRVENWIETETDSSEERVSARLWLDRMPEVGTIQHFEHCNAIMNMGSEFNRRTGKRCNADLVPVLVGLEGKRVECLYFGERIRFIVGKSTGWMPVHLRIAKRTSTGGDGLVAGEVKDVRIIRN